MNWSEVIADPCLQDLPYKIELNQYGAIVMTPASNRHGYLQTEIAFLLLGQQTHGRAQVECSVDTPAGVKVADVAWYSDQFFNAHGVLPRTSKPLSFVSRSFHRPTHIPKWLKKYRFTSAKAHKKCGSAAKPER